jgi:hypothetical protein
MLFLLLLEQLREEKMKNKKGSYEYQILEVKN